MDTLEQARRAKALAETELRRINAAIRPLEAERKLYETEQLAAAEIIAKHAETDADLLAVAGTTTGRARLETLAKALHPAVRTFCHWHNGAPTRRNQPVPVRLGLELALDYEPGDLYIAQVAAAIREFGTRFVPDPPQDLQRPGHRVLYALLRASNDDGPWHVEYDPDDENSASLYDRRDKVFTGTFREVLAHAANVAWYTGGPIDEDDD